MKSAEATIDSQEWEAVRKDPRPPCQPKTQGVPLVLLDWDMTPLYLVCPLSQISGLEGQCE